MPEGGFLRDLTVVFAASFPILFLCRKLKLPPVLGFLLTGVLIGPNALGWLGDTERVATLAEAGVVLILFFAGLEMPLERLRKLGKTTVISGTLQMGLTAALFAAALTWSREPLASSIFRGLILSLSSTAVVVPLLAARDELATPAARRFLSVSVFQDLAVIPLMLLVPALGGGTGAPPALDVARTFAVAIVGIALLVLAARGVVPVALRTAVRLGSREGFTAAVLVLVVVMVYAAERAGVSAPLGAFAAGVVLSESEFIHDVAAALSPFRDLLSSLFFVSIGMLLSPGFVAMHPLLVAGTVAAVLVAKTAVAFVALRAGGTVPRTALRAALPLAGVGELSFVLAIAGRRAGLLNEDSERLFVAIAVLSLAAVPLLILAAPRLSELLPERPEGEAEDQEHPLAGHVIVAGYGLNGKNVARVLSELRIPHVVLDPELDRVALARRTGSRALVADAARPESLAAANVDRAFAMVVATSDPSATRGIVRLARQKAPDLRIIVRTRYLEEVERLRSLGADEVIPEEFETSIEIVARLLRVFHVPGNVAAAQLRLLRDEGYRILRDPEKRRTDGRRLSALMAAGTTELFLVMPESAADGRTLAELNLPAEHVTVPLLLRDGVPRSPAPVEEPIAAGDVLLLVGAHEDLARVIPRLEARRSASAEDPRPAPASGS